MDFSSIVPSGSFVEAVVLAIIGLGTVQLGVQVVSWSVRRLADFFDERDMERTSWEEHAQESLARNEEQAEASRTWKAEHGDKTAYEVVYLENLAERLQAENDARRA